MANVCAINEALAAALLRADYSSAVRVVCVFELDDGTYALKVVQAEPSGPGRHWIFQATEEKTGLSRRDMIHFLHREAVPVGEPQLPVLLHHRGLELPFEWTLRDWNLEWKIVRGKTVRVGYRPTI